MYIQLQLQFAVASSYRYITYVPLLCGVHNWKNSCLHWYYYVYHIIIFLLLSLRGGFKMKCFFENAVYFTRRRRPARGEGEVERLIIFLSSNNLSSTRKLLTYYYIFL